MFKRRIFSQKVWIWKGVRREFGLRLPAKLLLPQTKLLLTLNLFFQPQKLFLTSFVCFSHDSAIRGCLRLLARSEATEAAEDETLKRRKGILLPTSTTNESPSTENICKTGKEKETETEEEKDEERKIEEEESERYKQGEDKNKEEETMEKEHERRIKGDVIGEIERKREDLGEDKDTERNKIEKEHGKGINGEVEREQHERESKEKEGKDKEEKRETDEEMKKSCAKNVDDKKCEKLFNTKVKRNEEGAKRFEKTLFTKHSYLKHEQ